MRIAINTRFLLADKLEGFGWYSYEICKRLVENHPEHDFIFFFDRPYDAQFVFGKNVTPVVLRPAARHPVLFVMWFEFAVKKALKKYKADVFFSPDGYLCLTSKVPQISVMHDINFVHFPKDLPTLASRYLNFFFPKFALKAAKIITVSEYSKQDIVASYKINPEKIKAIWNGASEQFKPLAEEQQDEIRQKYTQGKAYFVFVGSLHPRKNVSRLIAAYTLFKQHNDSGFDLLIVGENLWKNTNLNLPPSSATDSIHFTGRLALEELSLVMASAAALVYVPYFEGFGIPLVEAMRCGIPIIAGNKTSLPEVVGEAGLLVDPYSVEDIYRAMEKLFLDADLQVELAKLSLGRSTLFSWDIAAREVWEEIISVVENSTERD